MDKIYSLPSGAEVSIIPVLQGDAREKIDDAQLPETLPILALRDAALFPGAIFPITIGRESSMKLIRDAEKHNLFIGAVPQLEVMVEEPQEEDLYQFGTVARVLKTLEMPDGSLTAILQAYKRLQLDSVVSFKPYIKARVHYLEDWLDDAESTGVRALAEALKDKSIQIIRTTNMASREAIGALKAIDNFEFLVNFIATTTEVDLKRKPTSVPTN